nr:uncharacterized protein LOC103351297 isoform X1 [Oryctolagus cuniculus]XP_051678165.1 uncharacterized protein LOC103351297 isoform X1 [Oryctolagus cuniculus]XP_051678166.1 uncharacterized protein LOC103351297 isoform X1 [Oryctolagus cuniculus]
MSRELEWTWSSWDSNCSHKGYRCRRWRFNPLHRKTSPLGRVSGCGHFRKASRSLREGGELCMFLSGTHEDVDICRCLCRSQGGMIVCVENPKELTTPINKKTLLELASEYKKVARYKVIFKSHCFPRHHQ